MEDIVYNDDRRYPAPQAYPPSPTIAGLPTQAELGAQPRLFSFGELKDIIQNGDLGFLMRNKQLEVRYFEWAREIKRQYGSTENYLTKARLPWADRPVTPPTTSRPNHGNSLSIDLSHLDLPPSPTSPSSPESNAYPPPLSPKGEPRPNILEPNGDILVDIDVSLAAIDEPAEDTTMDNMKETSMLDASAAEPVTRRRHLRTPSITISDSGDQPSSSSGDVDSARLPALSLNTGAPSGSSTPASSGFVSLSSLKLVNGKLRSAPASGRNSPGGLGPATGQDASGLEGEEEGQPEYLRWEGGELDEDKYAVLPNDWPYCVPYGVRHYVVWSKVPIAHPHLVDYDPTAWSKIEADGLGGFTGVTSLYRRPGSRAPKHRNPDIPWDSAEPPQLGEPVFAEGRGLALQGLGADEWYGVDMGFAGPEQRKWAGRQYESAGGQEVGKMVKGLWDERGWECLWFVNPPRLQSVLGLSHFHVFARRKTPVEIDAAEAAHNSLNAART